MQYIKCCSMGWCPCINMSINDALSYIVAFFNYTEAFSLLWLTTLTFTGFQESCKVCHLLERPFSSLRVLQQIMKVFSLDSCLFISQCLFTVIISTRTKGKFIIIHYKHRYMPFSGSSDIKLQKLCLLKGVCQIHFKLKFSGNFQL